MLEEDHLLAFCQALSVNIDCCLRNSLGVFRQVRQLRVTQDRNHLMHTLRISLPYRHLNIYQQQCLYLVRLGLDLSAPEKAHHQSLLMHLQLPEVAAATQRVRTDLYTSSDCR